MEKDVRLVTHCKENVALVAILMTDHSLLFYICAATVITSVGSHGIVMKGQAAHCMYI